jgi:hypothetical protein
LKRSSENGVSQNSYFITACTSCKRQCFSFNHEETSTRDVQQKGVYDPDLKDVEDLKNNCTKVLSIPETTTKKKMHPKDSTENSMENQEKKKLVFERDCDFCCSIFVFFSSTCLLQVVVFLSFEGAVMTEEIKREGFR